MPGLRRTVSLLVVLLLAVTGCGSSDIDEQGSDASRDGDETPTLFMQTAASGVISTDAGAGTLRLEEVTSHVPWVTDRPERDAGRVSMQEFVDSWESLGFSQIPPNAFLDSVSDDGSFSTQTLILRDPTYDAAADSLVYEIELLSGSERTISPRALEQLVLFIDSGGTTSSLSVQVHDASSGAPLPGAVVSVSRSGDVRTATTSDSGSATIRLAPSIYQVQVTLSGFASSSSTVEVGLTQTDTRIDLNPG